MSSVVAEKQFVWRFIDKVTQGVKQARQAMTEAANSAKNAGFDVKESSTGWTDYGNKAKDAADKANTAMNKIANASRDGSERVRESVEKLNGSISRIPTSKTFNLKAKFDDQQLRSFSRKVHDVPDQKSIWLRIKDGFTAPLRNAQREIDNTKHSFSMLKSVMAGTFLGGAILNGVYAIGNGLKEAAGAGMQFDTEQQKMLATWHTLTNSTSQAKGMVNTINDLSIKTGQATDTINELEQGFYHLHSRKSEADDMTKAMLNMGDAVGLSGEQLTQVEQDMVHGLATGKVTQGELNQIGMYFPMIDERMAKHFHTTVAGMRKMASAGKITGKDLEEVFEQMGNSGKYKHAVDNMMQTTWGSMRTIRSMVPRLVGAMEEGLFQARNPLVGAIAKWTTDPATKKGFHNFGASIGNGLAELFKAFDGVNQAIGPLTKAFASGIWQGFATTIKAIAQGFISITSIIGKLLSWITSVSKQFGFLKVQVSATKALSVALGSLLAIITTYKTVTLVAAAATKAFSIAQTALDVAMDANPIGLVVIAVTALVGGLILAYKHIKPFRDAVNKVGQDIKKFFTGKLGWEKSVASEFSKLGKDFQKFAKKIPQFFKGVGKAIVKAIVIGLALPVGIAVTLMKPLIKPLQNSTKSLIKTVQKQWQSFSKWLGKLFDPVAKLWKRVWNGWTRIFSTIWKSLRKTASSGMKAIERLISPAVKAIEKVWTTSWNAIARFFSGIWRTITSLGKSGMQLLQGAISGPLNTISNIWHSAWNSISNFFKGIWDGIKQAAQDGMNGVINVINAGISAINKVWSFFTGHGTGVKELGHVHFAQGGVVRRHLSVINDGDGPDWKELVQTPDGNLFMSQERNWTGFLPEGTRVYSGPETRQIMNAVGVSHYASGGIVGDVEEGIDWAKGSLDNLGSWLGDKFSALEDFLADPLKATKGLLEKATNGLYNNLGHYADLAHGAMDKLTQPIANWFKKGLEKLEAQFESGGASPDLIRAAAAKMHVSISGADISHIMNVIQHESGGRANAVNNWDSNAAKGTPSKGILQFIEPTFMSYAMPGHTNILSPFDQLLAMFNDTTWRSDLTLGGWGPTGGRRYALGGEVFGLTNAIIGDNPQHHEFVLNPYAPSAEPLLDRAFEATADAQPSGQSGQAGNSKLDRMIELLEILVANVEGLDLNVSLDGEAIRRYNNKENAKEWQLRKG